jgi:hypothetical protein
MTELGIRVELDAHNELRTSLSLVLWIHTNALVIALADQYGPTSAP